MKNLRLHEHFECIKTVDDVKMVKPDPALNLETAKCLELHADECLVFAYSSNGMLATKCAGLKCVVVPNAVTEVMDFSDSNSTVHR